MKKEVVDGSTVYSNLFIDAEGITWNFLIRAGGSVSLYGTQPGEGVHHVVYDSLDGNPPNLRTRRIVHHLNEVADGIKWLTGALSGGAIAAQDSPSSST
jgi:hypothetical protein